MVDAKTHFEHLDYGLAGRFRLIAFNHGYVRSQAGVITRDRPEVQVVYAGDPLD